MPPLSSPHAWLVLIILFLKTTDLIRSGCNSGSRFAATAGVTDGSATDIPRISFDTASRSGLNRGAISALNFRLLGESDVDHSAGDLRELAHQHIEGSLSHPAGGRGRAHDVTP